MSFDFVDIGFENLVEIFRFVETDLANVEQLRSFAWKKYSESRLMLSAA